MKFRFLMENKTDGPGCVAEHGLSVYIEAKGRKLLFDAGPSERFVENAKHLGVDLKQVDAVIISHGQDMYKRQGKGAASPFHTVQYRRTGGECSYDPGLIFK